MDTELIKNKFTQWYEKNKPAIKETVETVVFVVVMVIIIRFFVGEIRWIPSGSMKPTLIEGDRIFVERFSRFYSTPKRGDIMVFYPPFEKLKYTPVKVFARLTGFFCKDIAYIKRVVGLPGDKYEIKPDEYGKYTVYINDKPLNEPYIKSPYDYTPCTEAMNCGPAVIPEGHYLMLGDNRGNSQDGRYWGLLPQDRFIGKAVFLFWPFTRAKMLTGQQDNYKE
ncbi:signal peptidase I [Spirochaetes bacterium]|uniref:Signal peptidase I n=1 Tax=Candidatus Scatousia excrementipullorum TaxID=2840936 RepID=A0A9D9DQH8_9BACT|nr:signal peptidase I [Candidatus Scatousia excrementipullorum]